MPTARAAGPDGEDADRLHGERDREDRGQESRPAAVVMNSLVEGLERPRQPDALEQRKQSAQERTSRAREEEKADHDRPEDEDAFEPEVCAHVVAADREQEADGSEQDGRRPSEPTLENDRSGHVRRPSRMSADGLDDAYGVTAE